MLTGRAENHIRGNPDLDDTIARLGMYEKAGADVLYAPGLRTVEEIWAVCDAVTQPVNVLALGNLSLAEITGAGAQRVSVGGGLAWVAVGAFAEAAAAWRDVLRFSDNPTDRTQFAKSLIQAGSLDELIRFKDDAAEVRAGLDLSSKVVDEGRAGLRAGQRLRAREARP